jgi:energy-converting hydrogenase Eha subunit B
MTDPAVPEMNPEHAALLARRVRLMMLVAGLTTALAMAAILITIGYRLFRGDGSAGTVSEITATLPKGARITSTAVSGDRVVVTVETAAGLELRTFDARTLKQTGRLRFATEP